MSLLFGRNTFVHCYNSRINVVHGRVIFLSEIHPVCHMDENRIIPGCNLNMTDKHAAEYSTPVCLGII